MYEDEFFEMLDKCEPWFLFNEDEDICGIKDEAPEEAKKLFKAWWEERMRIFNSTEREYR